MNLSPDQLAAIKHRGNHPQIIACAGAGKTEVMARRVTALIEEGVAPAAIIASTFTERAAAGLKLRIHNRIADSMGAAFLDRLGPMFVCTTIGQLLKRSCRYRDIAVPFRSVFHEGQTAFRGENHPSHS